MIRIITVSCLILGLAAPAQAEDEEVPNAKGSYWEMLLAGGMLMPLKDTADINKNSMAASMRLGWISRLGLGVDMTFDFSPVARQPTPAEDQYDVQFLSAGVMPRFTLGKKTLRLWLAAGGGMTYEHSEHVATQGTNLGPTTNKYAPAGMGAAGLELYAFSGVGLAVTGAYMRTYGDLQYEMLNLTGGLAVTFR